MSIVDGHAAIMRRIQAMPEAPHVVWPDDGTPPGDFNSAHPRPRYVMQAAGGSQSTDTVDDGTTEAEPEVVVRVETTMGDFGNANRDLVRALTRRFPAGLRFDGLTILAAPTVGSPITGGDTYAVPVTIRARMHF